MIIPAPTETLTAITVIFHKPLAEWSVDDQAAIVRRLRDFHRNPARFDRQTGRPRPRKRKVAK
jgi:hypothetical protein